VNTNHVAATCAVCGKYVPVRTGIPAGDGTDRKFRHEDCRDVAVGLHRAPPRPAPRFAAFGGLGERIASLPHPGLAGVAGALAVVFGVVLLFIAGGDDDGASPLRPAEVSDTRPDVSVLGETESADDVDSTTTTTVTDGTTTTTIAGAPVVPAGPTTTQRRTTTTRPGVTPPPADPGGPPTTAAPGTTGAPGTTAAPGSTTTRPPTTTTRPPTTTTRPPTTTSPPTTAPPTATPPTTTSPPTTAPPTTEPPTTTSPPTTAPPTTEPPPDIVDVLLDILT
jgi:hypothetical protein